jgi:selenophosphate synthase
LEKIGKGDIATETPDNSILKIRNSTKSLVSTIDFFYPLVEDPYTQGRIGKHKKLKKETL